MDRKKQAQIINDYHVNGLSYRTLGKKYGVPIVTLHRMINKKQEKDVDQEAELAAETTSPDDIKALKDELRKAKIKIELQDLMIDIASKELGVDLRKKPGTRQSK